MKITIIGTGYVGLVAGACFAETGNEVRCVDKDTSKIEALKKGKIPIYEPGLSDIVKRGIKKNRLNFTTSTQEAVNGAEIIFMAVGTPSLPNGEADLRYVEQASREVGQALTGPCIIVNKSTVPVGSHLKVAQWLASQSAHPVDVVSNPEFLKEGSAVDDFLKPERVVVGTDKEEVYQCLADLYAPFVRQGNPILWMDPISAELTKYACNAFLATRISFMNELSVLCDHLGGDIEHIRKGMTTDSRIGKHFLYPGVGYGGSCFPKDVKALLSTAHENKIQLEIVDAVERANERQKSYLVSMVDRHFEGNLKGKTFAIWGLAFKPNTDDLREAPSLTIMDALLKAGAKVKAFDPVAMENAKKHYGDQVGVEFFESSYETLEGSDALLLVTEWNEFRHPDFVQMKKLLKNPLIFDGRNIFNSEKIKEKGFTYFGIGRR
jgi:UDPglucose 6-dehydrogenase